MDPEFNTHFSVFILPAVNGIMPFVKYFFHQQGLFAPLQSTNKKLHNKWWFQGITINIKKMKKQFLLPLIAFTMMATAASAQKSPIHIGLKGGANFSKLPISSSGISSKYATGFSAGAFTRIDISKVYVQGELLFSKKASKFNSDLLNDQKVSWSSIEVPVLVGYKLLNMDLLNVRIFGGGVYSYTISEKSSLFKQINSSFNKFDKSNIGYQVGAGIDVGKLTFDLRYEGGLSSVSKQFKSRPNSFQASVGFMIF